MSFPEKIKKMCQDALDKLKKDFPTIDGIPDDIYDFGKIVVVHNDRANIFYIKSDDVLTVYGEKELKQKLQQLRDDILSEMGLQERSEIRSLIRKKFEELLKE